MRFLALVLLVHNTRALAYSSHSTLNRHHSRSRLSAATDITAAASSSDERVDELDFSAPVMEIDRRRNFAIISHPDAGKTTLTEKLLLFGGAIQDAGAVKARADQRKATSDWMEIEKARGISVTSTVLSFEYKLNAAQFHINLLDTPGHQDFSEDTYRTLAAADNCVMLIDAAKGVEDRTRKLFQVCRMRKLPIFTFANKLDRPSLSPFDIIDQLEREFSLQCFPMNWPIGDGDTFQGVYDRGSKTVHLFERGNRKKKVNANILTVDDPVLPEVIGEELFLKLMEDIEVLDALIPPLEEASIFSGDVSPIFFGSAQNNFGVELFLKTFLELARKPAARVSQDDVIIEPTHSQFTGFVFKLQANLDPRHRDRMAFIRICSGTFRKGMKVNHSRMKKQINLSSAQSLFAQDRESITEAFPGDVIGIHNPGHFAIGDTIYSGDSRVLFPGIPSFSPEMFSYIRNPNPSNYKKFQKGLSELLDEGAVQMLKERGDDGNGSPILAAVGQLQFEVVEYRLLHEYGVESKMEPLGYTSARWVGGGWDAIAKAETAGKLFGVYIVKDRWERPVLLFRNPWKVTQLVEDAAFLQLEPWAMPPADLMK